MALFEKSAEQTSYALIGDLRIFVSDLKILLNFGLTFFHTMLNLDPRKVIRKNIKSQNNVYLLFVFLKL